MRTTSTGVETEAWFWRWAGRHVRTNDRPDWPLAHDPYWDALLKVFREEHVTEEDAEAASMQMFKDPPSFLTEHVPRLLAAVRRLWSARTAAVPAAPAPVDLEAALFDRNVEAHWRKLSPQEQAAMIQLVARRAPLLAHHQGFISTLARAWAYNPELVWPEHGSRPTNGHVFSPKNGTPP